MRKRVLVFALILGAVCAGVALATTARGVTAETVAGDLARTNVHTKFANGGRVHLQTKGPIQLVVQRIEAAPGATFGWHHHPGENLNVMKQGTLTLYHDEDCTVGIPYGPGSTFGTHPSDVHLARNESETETVVFFATYFAPKTDPLVVRIDDPSPGPGCPE